MSKRTENNIGESAKTSVKVHNNPGGNSSWSLGWHQEQQSGNFKPQTTQKYHNESNLSFGGKQEEEDIEEQKKKEAERKKKEQELNSKLPNYDPKTGGKSNVFFGNEQTDYRKKDEVFTSVKVKNPPGGRSNIQFG